MRLDVELCSKKLFCHSVLYSGPNFGYSVLFWYSGWVGGLGVVWVWVCCAFFS
jgi:hypothetical protein